VQRGVGAFVTTGGLPMAISPPVPSMVMMLPSAIVRPPARAQDPATSTARSRTATTAGLPMARATTAAWLAGPPRAVTTPAAAAMPCRSSGEVSGRTRMTGPSAAMRAARSAVVASRPVATPGQAPSPRVRISAPAANGACRRGRVAPGRPAHGLAAADDTRVGQVDRDADGGPAGETARPHLQQPQPPASKVNSTWHASR
jgi:hypothetical protein